jgi:hypothetical protein
MHSLAQLLALAVSQVHMMDFINDVAAGALTVGVNFSTFVAVQFVLLLAIFSLIILLALSFTAYPFLVPHVVVLIFLAVGLWGLMIWLVGMTGLQEQAADNSSTAAAAASAAAGHDSKKQP